MNKFKVGDKVRVLKPVNSGHWLKVGSVAVVRGVPFDENDTYHLFGENVNGEDRSQWLYSDEFEITIDFSKAIYTAEGTPVTVLTTTNPRDAKWPVLVYEGKAKLPTKYNLQGEPKNGVARRKLTNEAPKVVSKKKAKRDTSKVSLGYLNIYDKGEIGSKIHATRKRADEVVRNGGSPFTGNKRVACIQIFANQYDK